MADPRSIISRIGKGLRGARPARPATAPEAPGLFPPGSGRTVLVTVLGIEAARLDEVIDQAAAVLSRFERLVFVTDHADFSPFRRRRLAFEYLPPPARRTGPRAGTDWARYLGARYELIVSKWQPVRVVSYGTPVPGFLAGAAS